jgi:hypothetical protein
VVWVAETYPGQYHIRLPGGATVRGLYHDITWERVPVETPATTVEDSRAEDRRLEAKAREWRQCRVTCERTWNQNRLPDGSAYEMMNPK